MTQFYIVEIKQLPNGEYNHDVFWVWDEDPDTARLKAESKYHQILGEAAVSKTLSDAAILFSTEGFPIMNQCYKHTVVPETPAPVEEPEEEPAETPAEDETNGEG